MGHTKFSRLNTLFRYPLILLLFIIPFPNRKLSIAHCLLLLRAPILKRASIRFLSTISDQFFPQK